MNISQPFLQKYIPSIVLISIAVLQIILVNTQNLSQWKGGGFGMFSTVDSRSARFVRYYIIIDGNEFPVKIPKHLKFYEERIRSLPTHQSAYKLASILSKATWVEASFNTYDYYYSSSSAIKEVPLAYRYKRESEPVPKPSELAHIDSFKLEVWVFKFDSKNLRLEADKKITVQIDKR